MMGNEPNKKPNLLELEAQREELINKTLSAASNISKVHLYFEFFNKVLSYHSLNLAEVFLKELIDDYITSISKFDVWGTEPQKTEAILSQFKNLTEFTFFVDKLEILKDEIGRIETQLEGLNSILHVRDKNEDKDEEKDKDEDKEKTCQPLADEEHKAFFPLIDKEAAEGFYGVLESVTVSINKATEGDKFILVPSEKEIEKKILEQTKTSWYAALNLSKAYIKKPYNFHEVIISFDKKDGFYTGSSLGIALTVSFLEQLLKYYNPTYFIKIKEQTTFTGGITEEGKVLSCGEEIIKQKVKAVFFSKMNAFVMAKEDEIPACEQLLELQKDYPQRNLKLIPVEDINDVLNRRDVVDIKKQKFILRTVKFVKKNWVSAVGTVLLAILFAFLFVMDWDDNPAYVTLEKQLLHVRNKKGKMLWMKKLGEDFTKKEFVNAAKMIYKFEDINKDELKELILCFEFFTQGLDTFNPGRIVCYDFQGKQMWEYVFEDSIFSKGEWQPNIYSTYMIDLLSEGNEKVLYAIASNANFAGAIFRLDAATGKRMDGTLWNAGHFQDGVIGDFNQDGKEEIVLTAINNGFEKTLLTSVNLENLHGQLPSADIYRFKDIQPAVYNKFILLPVSDYAKYLGARFNIISRGGLRITDNEFSMLTIEEPNVKSTACLNYRFDINLNCIDIECSDELQVKRDSLVVNGILQKPFTNTPEYELKIKNEIIYQ